MAGPGNFLGALHSVFNPPVIPRPTPRINIREVPEDDPSEEGDMRQVFIGSEPLDIHRQILGPILDLELPVALPAPPHRTFHWEVVVGGYVHELNYNERGLIFYRSRKWDGVNRPQVDRLFPVCVTRFNDSAICEAGGKAISDPPMRPQYHFWNNNCQHFTVNLLDLICCPDANRNTVTTLDFQDRSAGGGEEHEWDQARKEAKNKALEIMSRNT